MSADQTNQAALSHINDSVALSRLALSMALGKTHQGARDIYSACGYPMHVSHQEMVLQYQRGDLAKRIVNAYPDACWRELPQVWDTERSKESPFEKKWGEVVETTQLWQHIRKVDRLCGLGRYAVLFLGFNDSEVHLAPKMGSQLVYVRAYREGLAGLGPLNLDPTSPRFGLPLSYSLSECGLANVHWQRVIHVAEDPMDGEIYAEGRLLAVWNRLLDIMTVMGASAESFWRSGFPRTLLTTDADARIQPGTREKVEEEYKEMVNGLKDMMLAQGLTPKPMPFGKADPESTIRTILWFISACTGIPYRLLTGTEEGQLAGTQDRENWEGRVRARRAGFCRTGIVIPLVKRLVQLGALPVMQGSRQEPGVDWVDAGDDSPESRARVAGLRVSACSGYLSGGVEQLIPRKAFLVDELGLDEEVAKGYLDEVAQMEAARIASGEADQALAGQRMEGEPVPGGAGLPPASRGSTPGNPLGRGEAGVVNGGNPWWPSPHNPEPEEGGAPVPEKPVNPFFPKPRNRIGRMMGRFLRGR